MTPVRPVSAVPAEIDAGDRAGLPSSDVVAVAAFDGEGHSAEGGRSAIFDAAQTVRGFGRAFSELPAGFSDTVEVDRRWHWRPAPAVWSALQHTAHFADLLVGIAADLSYLLDGELRAGFDLPAERDSVSDTLDTDAVLAMLAADSERVARLLEAAPANPGEGAGFPIAVGGVIVTLARKAVSDGVSALAAAHDALTGAAAAPPPPNADGAAIGYVDVSDIPSGGRVPNADRSVVPSRSPAVSLRALGTGRRCLVIGDAEDARFLLGVAVSRAGYDVVAEAATAAAGLAAAVTASPDIVLADLVLPDADDGVATVAALRAVLADAVIVVCSDRSADDMASVCVAAGADGYLEKSHLLDIAAVLGGLAAAAARGDGAAVSESGNGPPPGGCDDKIGAGTAMIVTGVGDGDGAPVVQKSKLADSLADMAGLLFDEIGLESLLQLVVSLACSTLDVADEASVSVVHAGVFDTITATSAAVRDLDHVQYEFGRGPCVAATRGERVTTGFAHESGRWPEFAAAGVARGFAGVLAIPLTVGTRHLGAVNLYSRTRATFAAADADAAQVFADHAAVALANAVSFANARVLNESLADALKSRDVIAMAKALLMNRDGLSAAEAFAFLRRTSRQRNTTVRELSQEIIDRGHSSGHGDIGR